MIQLHIYIMHYLTIKGSFHTHYKYIFSLTFAGIHAVGFSFICLSFEISILDISALKKKKVTQNL